MATGVGVGSGVGVGVGVGAANTSFVTPNSAPRSSVELTGMLPVITAPAAMSSTKKVLLPTIFPERSIIRTEMLPENNVSASVVLEIVTSTQDEDSLTVVSTEIPATGSPLRGKVCIAAVGLGDGVAEVSLPPQAARGVSIRQQRKIVNNFFIITYFSFLMISLDIHVSYHLVSSQERCPFIFRLVKLFNKKDRTSSNDCGVGYSAANVIKRSDSNR